MNGLPGQECIALGALLFLAGLGVPFHYAMEKLREFGRYTADALLACGKFVIDKLPPK